MKKIAIVIADLGAPGGAEKVAVDLATEFHRRKYDVTIIRFDVRDTAHFPHPCKEIQLPLPGKKGGTLTQIHLLAKRAWAFRKCFQQAQFDYIFSFLEASNVACALATPKSVLSMHLDPNTMTSKEWFLVRWLYPRARRVIAVSRQMQQLLEKKAGLHNAQCVYNPINTALIQKRAAEDIVIKQPFILAVGRLEQQKRFDRLLAAYASSDAKETYKLVIVGSGSLEKSLKKQIQRLKLEQQVIMAGYDNNPYKYMSKADFLVMSSDYEGYPLTLIEALSLGCPAISTDCPTGPKEIISHGINGLLTRPKSATGLTDAIDKLAKDAALRQYMSQKARLSVLDNDIKQVANQWLQASEPDTEDFDVSLA